MWRTLRLGCTGFGCGQGRKRKGCGFGIRLTGLAGWADWVLMAWMNGVIATKRTVTYGL